MANSNPLPYAEGKLGGKREGAGRPKGSLSIHSNKANKKLEQLGFCPITMMVQKYHDIQKSIDHLESINKHTSGAYAQLISTQGQLINNLMQYGYKKIPDKSEIVLEEKKPVSVMLTGKLLKDNKDGESKSEDMGESKVASQG